jgi:hypothetical protein
MRGTMDSARGPERCIPSQWIAYRIITSPGPPFWCGVDQLSACVGARNLLHWRVIGSTRARVVSVVGFLVGKPARAMETAFRINRLCASSSPLLGTNFKRLRNIPNVLLRMVAYRGHRSLECNADDNPNHCVEQA